MGRGERGRRLFGQPAQTASVLVSLVGPFTQHGAAAAEAAIAAGCTYIDGTGEADFIRDVPGGYGPRAKSTSVAMVTACGYDVVLGNLAGSLALDRAPSASRHTMRSVCC